MLPLSGIGIRVRAQVEELPGDAWRTASPPAGPAAPPAEADLRAGRPEPVFASAEPAERWPDLPPSLEAPAGGPGLREWERIRGLMAEQRGG